MNPDSFHTAFIFQPIQTCGGGETKPVGGGNESQRDRSKIFSRDAIGWEGRSRQPPPGV